MCVIHLPVGQGPSGSDESFPGPLTLRRRGTQFSTSSDVWIHNWSLCLHQGMKMLNIQEIKLERSNLGNSLHVAVNLSNLFNPKMGMKS